MAALPDPPREPGEEPELILEWPSLQAPAIRGRAWVGSLLAHAVAIGGLIFGSAVTPPPHAPALHSQTILIAPPSDLGPRQSRLNAPSREFSLNDLVPRPPVRVPAAIPPMMRRSLEPPTPQRPPAMLPEPPNVETARAQPPSGNVPPGSVPPVPGAPPPPQIQAEEKPKLAFETPGAPSDIPKLKNLPPTATPGSSVMEATRDATHTSHSSTSVGDYDLPGSPGIGGGITQIPVPPKNRSNLELMPGQDTSGVDFRPYLIRVLASVRRNWMSVIPESARLGRTGRVQIQFAIARDGSVPKLVFVLQSGTDALDRAAVAGISASQPFPPFPTEFKGNQVRLQMTFSYNIR